MTEEKKKRGGARVGAGRKAGTTLNKDPMKRKRTATVNLSPFHQYVAQVLVEEKKSETASHRNGLSSGVEAALKEVAETRGLNEEAFLAMPDAARFIRGTVRKNKGT